MKRSVLCTIVAPCIAFWALVGIAVAHAAGAPRPDPPPGAKLAFDNHPYVVEWKQKGGRWSGHWIFCVIDESGSRCFAVVAKGGPKPRVKALPRRVLYVSVRP